MIQTYRRQIHSTLSNPVIIMQHISFPINTTPPHIPVTTIHHIDILDTHPRGQKHIPIPLTLTIVPDAQTYIHHLPNPIPSNYIPSSITEVHHPEAVTKANVLSAEEVATRRLRANTSQMQERWLRPRTPFTNANDD